MYRIVHIARPLGGVGVYVNLLVNHVDDKKFENILISNKQETLFKIKNKSQQPIPEVHVDLNREINLIEDIKCLFQIVRALKTIKPDIIHCHSTKAGLLGRVAGAYLRIPTFFTPNAFSYLSGESKLKRAIFITIEKLFRFLPAKILACSQSEYDRARNDLGFKKRKLYLWSNSIKDVTELTPSKITATLPKKFICSIGRPSYQKNIEMLVEMILQLKKTIKEVHLVLLGVGLYSPTLDSIEKLIKQNGLADNITLVSWLGRAETMSILKACHIYVSSARYEGLPYAVIEALSLAKPCVVTKVDGNKDLIINGYNGYLVKNENAKAMAEMIRNIYNNNEKRKTLSENSRKEYLSKYNIKDNIQNLENIYLEGI